MDELDAPTTEPASTDTLDAVNTDGLRPMAVVGAATRRIILRTFIALADQGVVSGASFTSTVLLARGATVAELGVYQLAISVIQILRAVQAELVTAPFTINHCRLEGDRLLTYVGSTLVHQFVTTLVAAVGLLLLLLVTQQGIGPGRLAQAAAALLIVGPVVLVRDFLRQFSFSMLRPGAAFLVDSTSAVLQLAALLGLYYFDQLSVFWAFIGIGLSAVIASGTWWNWARPDFRIDVQDVVRDWKTNWNFSRWALASQLICSCTPYILPWIVAVMRDLDETGRMSACITLMGMSALLTSAIGNVLTPQASRTFAKHGWSALGRVIRNTVALFLVGHGAFCAFAFFAGEWLLTFVYGTGFAGMGLACAAVAVSNLANSLSVAAGNTLWAVGRPQLNLPADITTNSSTLIASFFLIPEHGSYGAILGTLIGVTCGAIVRWLFVWRNWGRRS